MCAGGKPISGSLAGTEVVVLHSSGDRVEVVVLTAPAELSDVEHAGTPLGSRWCGVHQSTKHPRVEFEKSLRSLGGCGTKGASVCFIDSFMSMEGYWLL